MSSPLKAIGKFLFGTPATPAAPAMPTPAVTPPPPAQAPQGSASSNKPANAPSFLAAAAPGAAQQNTSTKSLLGQ